MRILETKLPGFFLPSQAKKTKLPIFHLWQERMGGCFFKSFLSFWFWHWLVGFGFRKFQMDDAGWISWGMKQTLKDVFWLWHSCPHWRQILRTSDEDVLLWGVLCFPFLVGLLLIQPQMKQISWEQAKVICVVWVLHLSTAVLESIFTVLFFN